MAREGSLINPNAHNVVIVCDGNKIRIFEDGKELKYIKSFSFSGVATNAPTLTIEKDIR
ncbi:hypothetical protein PD280_06145 [Virgibacillus salarius]|uniref:hypothetical protein n=1 Tax=Virgibacillus salarius TaxID=447199 RepID=UPI00248FC239|nr:hypothetical protein [Virgibacillus salarius]WBX81299.1 hypothetical protein PD280_06145 [Virgibacillus salarius]